MLITALAVGGLLVWSPVLHANDSANTPPSTPPVSGPTTGQPSRGGFERMAERLKLSGKQRSQVQEAIAAQTEQMNELMQNTNLAGGDRNAKIKAIHKNTAAQMATVLNTDQFQQWQNMQSKMRAPRTGPHTKALLSTNIPVSIHFAGMVTNLNLTADQIPKVKAVKDTEMQSIYALRQQQPMTIEIRRVKMRHIHEDTAAQLKTILTTNQWAAGLTNNVPEIINQ